VTPRRGGGFTLRISDEEVSAWALVGAWGRQTLPGLRAHGRPSPHRGWLGIKRHYTGLELGTAVELYLLPGGYVGLAGIGEDRVNCTALVSLAAFRRSGGGVGRFFDWAARQNRGLALRLAKAKTVSGSEVTISGVDTGQMPHPWIHLPVPEGVSAVMPPVPLMGDAAAVIPPLAGDGMAMALHTAELLRPLLIAHLAGQMSVHEMVEAYSHQYRQEFTQRLGVARWLQAGLIHPVAGELLLRLGCRLPGLSERALLATRGPIARPPVRTGSSHGV
jgi:2-polyprenyl-6-methoxyphenol hydroxylase-like FAD-dependent oxidoreductase